MKTNRRFKNQDKPFIWATIGGVLFGFLFVLGIGHLLKFLEFLN